jgi:YD repeat-containing protein
VKDEKQNKQTDKLIPDPCFLIPVFLLLSAVLPLYSESWYKSNASGLAIEPLDSRFVALREEYSLCVREVSPNGLPLVLAPYYDPSYSVETRTLYENGGEIRLQWLFRDAGGVTRLNGAGLDFDAANGGFIETYDKDGSLTEERKIGADGSEDGARYFYSGGVLVKAENWRKDESPESVLIATDTYRYTRSGSLRSIDRVFANDIPPEGSYFRLAFPSLSRDFSNRVQPIKPALMSLPDFFLDIAVPEGAEVSYSIDARGRVLKETHTDADGKVVGELINSWDGDRLLSVEWKSERDERRTEYAYDAGGNRVKESDYRSGVLERTMFSQGRVEIEELYMNGVPVLKATFENGRKVSEERLK